MPVCLLCKKDVANLQSIHKEVDPKVHNITTVSLIKSLFPYIDDSKFGGRYVCEDCVVILEVFYFFFSKYIKPAILAEDCLNEEVDFYRAFAAFKQFISNVPEETNLELLKPIKRTRARSRNLTRTPTPKRPKSCPIDVVTEKKAEKVEKVLTKPNNLQVMSPGARRKRKPKGLKCKTNECFRVFQTFADLTKHVIKEHNIIEPLHFNLYAIARDQHYKLKNKQHFKTVDKKTYKSLFPCLLQYCNYQNDSVKGLIDHKINVHEIFVRYFCAECNNLRFTSKLEFQIHMEEKHLEEVVMCPICNMWMKPFETPAHMEWHMHSEGRTGPEDPEKREIKICLYCKMNIASEEELRKHDRLHRVNDLTKALLQPLQIKNKFCYDANSNVSNLPEENATVIRVRIQSSPQVTQRKIVKDTVYDSTPYTFNRIITQHSDSESEDDHSNIPPEKHVVGESEEDSLAAKSPEETAVNNSEENVAEKTLETSKESVTSEEIDEAVTGNATEEAEVVKKSEVKEMSKEVEEKIVAKEIEQKEIIKEAEENGIAKETKEKETVKKIEASKIVKEVTATAKETEEKETAQETKEKETVKKIEASKIVKEVTATAKETEEKETAEESKKSEATKRTKQSKRQSKKIEKRKTSANEEERKQPVKALYKEGLDVDNILGDIPEADREVIRTMGLLKSGQHISPGNNLPSATPMDTTHLSPTDVVKIIMGDQSEKSPEEPFEEPENALQIETPEVSNEVEVSDACRIAEELIEGAMHSIYATSLTSDFQSEVTIVDESSSIVQNEIKEVETTQQTQTRQSIAKAYVNPKVERIFDEIISKKRGDKNSAPVGSPNNTQSDSQPEDSGDKYEYRKERRSPAMRKIRANRKIKTQSAMPRSYNRKNFDDLLVDIPEMCKKEGERIGKTNKSDGCAEKKSAKNEEVNMPSSKAAEAANAKETDSLVDKKEIATSPLKKRIRSGSHRSSEAEEKKESSGKRKRDSLDKTIDQVIAKSVEPPEKNHEQPPPTKLGTKIKRLGKTNITKMCKQPFEISDLSSESHKNANRTLANVKNRRESTFQSFKRQKWRANNGSFRN